MRQWRGLLRFRSTWGLILGGFCVGYGLWMYVTWLPGYLESAYNVSIARTGYLASIPLIFAIAGSFFGGYVSDHLIKRGNSILMSRKIPTSLGLLGSCLFTGLAAGAAQAETAVLWITLSMFFLYFSIAAKWTMITAVAPQHFSASVSGLQNLGSYLGGALSPVLTGFLLDRTGSFVLALGIGSVVMAAGAAIYYVMVTSAIPDSGLDPLPVPDVASA